MRFVELKEAEQLDMQSRHRVRDPLVGQRTARMNQLRAILLERGIVVPQGRRRWERQLVAILQDETTFLSRRMQLLLEDMQAEWRGIDRRIAALNEEFATRAKADDTARLLPIIPGIGVLNATALRPPSATPPRSPEGGTSRPGLASCRGR